MSNVLPEMLAQVAALIGDAGRARMLSALMGGQALTAGELARHAGVTAQTTSGHLARLTRAGLLALEKQGRHRYYRLASPQVAEAIHALMQVAAAPSRPRVGGPRDEAMRVARTCYDHMAGRLAVALADTLNANGHIVLADGAGLVTEAGRRFFRDTGVALQAAASRRRPLCRTCLDWSERRHHLAGSLGAALLEHFLGRGWVARVPGSRTLRVTHAGEVGFVQTFRLPLGWRSPAPGPGDGVEP